MISYVVRFILPSVVLASFFIFNARGQDDICLSCLCEASTLCNASTGCTPVDSNGKYFCGPFLMSKDYWTDAGNEVLGGDSPANNGAFENCANDFICSAGTVRQYMTNFAQDCNLDGVVNCQDFAFIHVLGGYGCQEPAFTQSPFYQRFSSCMNVLTAAQPLAV